MRLRSFALRIFTVPATTLNYAGAFQSNPYFIDGGFRGLSSQKRHHQIEMKRFAFSSSNRNTKALVVDEGEIRKTLVQHQSVHDMLVESIKILQQNSAPEPAHSACHLLSFAMKDEFAWEDNGFAQLLNIYDSKINNMALSEKVLTRQEIDDYVKMLARRIAKEPLQYIIGQWDFHDCVLKVRQPLLCPRPETEELVEHAAGDIRRMIQSLKANGEERRIRILDVGCGTGAIGVAIAKLFPNHVTVCAIDVSEAAKSLSAENAKFVLGENQTIYQEPILCSAAEYSNENKKEADKTFQFRFDLIVSNPPYIPSKDMDSLTYDVVDFEDHRALCGGDDGLDVVRDILTRSPEWFDVGEDNLTRGFNPVIWIEVDTSHPILIEGSVEAHQQINFIESLKDFGGLDRFVKLEVNM